MIPKLYEVRDRSGRLVIEMQRLERSGINYTVHLPRSITLKRAETISSENIR